MVYTLIHGVDISELKPEIFSKILLKEHRNTTEKLRGKSKTPVQESNIT